jgi:indolepyruvate ferredoxin oxidoreductase
LLKSAQVIEFIRKTVNLDDMIAKRVEFLTGYQNAAYAQQYLAFVEKVRAAEAPLNSKRLTEAVARYLFKLMAYKDEYEVARLHTDQSFLDKVAAQFEGDYKLNYHLAPPLLSKKNDKGELKKMQFGPWMQTGFKLLAKLKGLRGTAFDVFGRTEERKTERALIGEYRAAIDELLGTLNAANLALAADIARIPEDIRGYGHVKERHLKAARPKWTALMGEWRAGGQRRAA